MNVRKKFNQVKMRRRRRNRARIIADTKHPRLSVFRSNTGIYAQLIDDAKGHTLAHASSRELGKVKKTKMEAAAMVGELISKKAAELGIKQAIFDRGSYRYHGRVKAVADGARKGGLKI